MKRMLKSMLATLLAFSVVIGMCPVMQASAEVTSLSGAGTAASPYQIGTADELKFARDQINADTAGTGARAAYYELTADIDLENGAWTPIGIPSSFTGNFDGKNHIIRNVKVERTPENLESVYGTSSKTAIGFFASISGTVKNLGLDGVTVTNSVKWTSSSQWNYGQLRAAGAFAGWIGNSACVIENCFVKNATVTQGADNTCAEGIGGFVGGVHAATPTIKNCYVYNVTIGTQCADAVSGFFGATRYKGVKITNCYVAKITNTTPANKAAFYGFAQRRASDGTSPTVTKGFSESADIEGTTGTYVSTNSKGTVGASKETIVSEMTALGFTTNARINDGYPCFEWEVTALPTPTPEPTATPYVLAGAGTEASPYQVSSAKDLKLARDMINADTDGTSDRAAYYELTADIDLENEVWTPIGVSKAFTGSFDGKGHTISNIYVERTDENLESVYGTSGKTSIGFFGTLSGQVKNLGLDGVTAINSVQYENSTQWAYGQLRAAGAFAGYIGTSSCVIENCFVKNATVTQASGSSSMEGIGGFAGGVHTATPTIKNCYIYNVTIGTQCADAVSGFFGATRYKGVKLINCYAAKITNTTNGAIAAFYGFTQKRISDGTLPTVTKGFSESADVPGTSGAYVATNSKGDVGKTKKELITEMTALGYTKDKRLNDGYPCLLWEAAALPEIPMPEDDELVEEMLNGLEMSYVATPVVSSDIVLPLATSEFIDEDEAKDCIKWTSSDSTFIIDEGNPFIARYNAPFGKSVSKVTLTATCTYGEASGTKTFEIRVKDRQKYEVDTVIIKDASGNRIYCPVDGAVIESVSYTANSSETAEMYLAIYDASGRFVTCQVKSAENGICTFNQPINANETYKVFLWKGDTVTPLAIPETGEYPKNETPKIFIIGDELARTYASTSKQQGFGRFLDAEFVGATVDNTQSVDGNSSKNALKDGGLKYVLDNSAEGDYLFVMLGHNDEAENGATVEEYKAIITQMVTAVKDKGVIPVILTPVARAKWNDDRTLKDTHKDYREALYEVAEKTGTALIDVDTITRDMLKDYTYSTIYGTDYFVEYVYTSEIGARDVAGIISDELEKMNLPISRLVTEKVLIPDEPTEAQAAALARGRQLTDFQFTPVADIPVAVSARDDIGYFEAGSVVTGFPYSSAESNDKFVCENVSFETFLSAVANPDSVLYTKSLWSPGVNASTYYGLVCNSFVRYCLGIRQRCSTAVWLDIPGMNVVSYAGQYDAEFLNENLQLCDVLHANNDGSNHVVLITGIWRNEEGDIEFIEVSEGTRATCSRTLNSVEHFLRSWKPKYKICRYEYLDSIPPFDEEQNAILYSGIDKIKPMIAVDYGNKSNYFNGETTNISSFAEGANTVEIYRDGELIESVAVNGYTKLSRVFEKGYYVVKLAGTQYSTEFCVVKPEISHTVENGVITITASSGDPQSNIIMMDFRQPHSGGASLVQMVTLTDEEMSSGIITREIPEGAGTYKIIFENKYGIWTHSAKAF